MKKLILFLPLVLASCDKLSTDSSFLPSYKVETVKNKVDQRFEKLSQMINRWGYVDTFKRLNGHEDEPTLEDQFLDRQFIINGTQGDGGITCVEEGGNILVSTQTPRNIGKKVDDAFVAFLVDALRKANNEKAVVDYGKIKLRVWGRKPFFKKSLLNEEKKHIKKFMCYIPFHK